MLSAPPGPDSALLPASLPLALLSSHSHTLTISTTGSSCRPGDAKQWDVLPFLLLESRPLGCAAGTAPAVLSPLSHTPSQQPFLPGRSAFPGSSVCPSLPSSADDLVVGVGFLDFSGACFLQGTLGAARACGAIRDVSPPPDSSSRWPCSPYWLCQRSWGASHRRPAAPPQQSIGVRHPRPGEPFLCGSLC